MADGPEMRSGWQASIEHMDTDGIDTTQDGDMLDMVPTTDRATADRVAASMGCMVEEPIDEENGLWMLRIPQSALDILRTDGEWSDTNEHGRIAIDAGEVFGG